MNPALEKKSVLLVVLFSVVTLAIYIPIWLKKRVEGFNQLNSKVKINNISVMAVLVLYCLSAILLIPSILFVGTPIEKMIDESDRIISFVGVVLVIYETFKIRTILEDHFKVKMSGLATFFFGICYLQYKINRLGDTARPIEMPKV